MQIIPAIDIIDGKCVRLTQGDYAQKTVYETEPLELAKRFEAAGLRRLHLVDLDGAKQRKIVNYKVLEQIASQTKLHIDFGGGIQSEADVYLAFECGAKQITGGSIAVRKPEVFEQWIEIFGAERIILGADVKNEKIAIGAWTETSEHDLWSFLEHYVRKGIRYVVCTDVSKDGLLQGTSVDLYAKIRQQFPDLGLIASGGVTDLKDLETLQSMGVWGAIVGKAIYEGRISLESLVNFL